MKEGIEDIEKVGPQIPSSLNTELGVKVARTKADKEVVISACIKEALDMDDIDEKIEEMEEKFEEFKDEE